MKVLIIIPAFNEEGNLGELINVVRSYGHDVIVINDCSTDNTLEVCKRHSINHIDLPNNLGIGGAVQTGYQYALIHEYDVAIQIDGDGQHDPTYISSLIKPILEKRADLVIGSRYISKEGFQSSLIRRIGIMHFSFLIKMLFNKKITDPTSGLRACNKSVIKLFASNYPIDYPEPETIVTLLRKKFKVIEIPVKMSSREHGTSSINKIRAVYYMIKVSLAILIDFMRKKETIK